MDCIIWGSANNGLRALEVCKSMRVGVKAFLDSNPEKQGKYIDGSLLKIFSPDEYNNIAEFDNMPIIMATKDEGALARAKQLSKNVITFGELMNALTKLEKKNYPAIQLQTENIENCVLIDRRENLLHKFPQGMIMAEFGVFKGDFSQMILDICKPSKLYLIDAWVGERWENYYSEVQERFAKEIASGIVEIKRGYSTEMLATFCDGELDWAYIDTIHDYTTTKEELELCRLKVKQSGLICGHDYTKFNVYSRIDYGVWDAVNEFAVKNRYSLKYMTMEHHGCKSFALEKLDNNQGAKL